MKKKILGMLFMIGVLSGAISQTILAEESKVEICEETFPDEAFRTRVMYYDENADGFLSQAEIEQVTFMNVNSRSVESIQGVEVFYALSDLECSEGQLKEIPALPTGLKKLDCSYNKLTTLPALPEGLIELNCDKNNLEKLPELPESLRVLKCQMNKMYKLPQLPDSLELLSCRANQIDYISKLPSSLKEMHCGDNKLYQLPELPEGLRRLTCFNNDLSSLPKMPDSLEELSCYDNTLTGELDLSNCENLQWLKGYNNYLRKIFLPENNQISTILVQNNRIENITDITGLSDVFWTWISDNHKFCPQKTQEHLWELDYVISPATFSKDGQCEYQCPACNKHKVEKVARVKTAGVSTEIIPYDGKVKSPSVYLKDENGTRLHENEDYELTYQTGRKEVGKYYVKVSLKGLYEGSKKLYFVISPAKPKNLKAELYGYNDIKLSWKASDKASGYSIYRYKSSLGNKYEFLGKTKNTWYKMANCKNNAEYSFVVEPYFSLKGDDTQYKGVKSEIISISTMCQLSAPTIIKDTEDAVEISWKTTAGASGYQLKYRIPETGATRTFNRTGRSMIYNQPKNVTIYYKIRPYKTENGKKIYGPWSKETSFYLGYVGALKSLKVQLTGYNDVKLSWKKASGANKYYVYYKRANMDEFEKLGSTNKLNYSKNNIRAGEKYEFKVLPVFYNGGKVQKKGTEDTIDIYTLKKLNKPEVKKNGTKVIINWDNINGETGYQISQSTSKTGTKIVTTFATTKGTQKTISATKGKKYYYKVRAYKTVNGVKIYAPWSDTIAYTRK